MAPRLCGTETGQSDASGPTSSRDSAVPYRMRKNRNQYAKFGDGSELYAMAGRGRTGGERAVTVEIGAGRDSSGDDDRSDKAIMENLNIVQTKTVTVAYE